MPGRGDCFFFLGLLELFFAVAAVQVSSWLHRGTMLLMPDEGFQRVRLGSRGVDSARWVSFVFATARLTGTSFLFFVSPSHVPTSSGYVTQHTGLQKSPLYRATSG